MCSPPAVKGLGQDWGTKCTIDAKRAWKIFYITPGEGSGGGGRPMKARTLGGGRARAAGGGVVRDVGSQSRCVTTSSQPAFATAVRRHPLGFVLGTTLLAPGPCGVQVVFKNLRIMNGNSKEGFGGAVEVSGPVDLQFIDCEFGGSVSASFRLCTA